MDGAVLRYSGADATSPIDVSGTNAASGNPLAPNVTTTAADTVVVRLAALENASVSQISPRAATTQRFEVDGSGDQVAAAADSVQAVAGATGPAAFTGSSDDYVAATIVIAPPAGGGTTY